MKSEEKRKAEEEGIVQKTSLSPRERAGRRGDRSGGGHTGGRREQHLARHREGVGVGATRKGEKRS